MSDPRETLARIRAQADAATDGPWEAEQPPGPGEDPMRSICVYPKEGGGAITYVQPLEADAEFIAATRTNVPHLVDALEAVLNLHAADEDGDCAECIRRAQGRGDQSYPCPTVTTITTALEGEADA